jgi:hypothetical protein
MMASQQPLFPRDRSAVPLPGSKWRRGVVTRKVLASVGGQVRYRWDAPAGRGGQEIVSYSSWLAWAKGAEVVEK